MSSTETDKLAREASREEDDPPRPCILVTAWAYAGHSAWVDSAAFSPDGKRLASASGDKTVKVWDAQIGQELLPLKGGGGVAFSPNGHWLASGAEDGTVKIWDATPLPEKR